MSLDLSAEPLSLDQRLLRGQVTVQLNISHKGTLRVRHMSPTLPFYVGSNPRTCDLALEAQPAFEVGDRCCLFEIRSDLVFLSPRAQSAGAAVTVGRKHLPLRIQAGELTVDLAWSEDPEVCATWAAPEVTNFNKKYGHSVRCTGVVPVRMHCSSCGLDLAGTVNARGASRDLKRSVAELEARRNAAENAARDARLSVCASCGHWLTGSIGKLWLAMALQLSVVLGVALCLWLWPLTRALFAPLGLVGILAAAKSAENAARWRAGARRRFTPHGQSDFLE